MVPHPHLSPSHVHEMASNAPSVLATLSARALPGTVAVDLAPGLARGDRATTRARATQTTTVTGAFDDRCAVARGSHPTPATRTIHLHAAGAFVDGLASPSWAREPARTARSATKIAALTRAGLGAASHAIADAVVTWLTILSLRLTPRHDCDEQHHDGPDPPHSPSPESPRAAEGREPSDAVAILTPRASGPFSMESNASSIAE